MLQKQIRVCKEITAQASFRAQLNQLSLLLSYKAIKCFRVGVVPAQQDPRGVFREFHPKIPLELRCCCLTQHNKLGSFNPNPHREQNPKHLIWGEGENRKSTGGNSDLTEQITSRFPDSLMVFLNTEGFLFFTG